MHLSELHGAATHLAVVAIPLLALLLVLRRLGRGGVAARAWEPWVLGAAVLGLAASGLTGLLVRGQARTELRGADYDVGGRHFWLGIALAALVLAVGLLWLAGRAAGARPGAAGGARAAALSLAAIAAVLVVAQGYLGGRMTFEHGVGVNALGQGRQTAIGDARLAADLARGVAPEDAGARAFATSGLGCASCHGPLAGGDRGPRLAGGRELAEFRAVHGRGLFPPQVVTDEDFAAVNAYLRSLG